MGLSGKLAVNFSALCNVVHVGVGGPCEGTICGCYPREELKAKVGTSLDWLARGRMVKKEWEPNE